MAPNNLEIAAKTHEANFYKDEDILFEDNSAI